MLALRRFKMPVNAAFSTKFMAETRNVETARPYEDIPMQGLISREFMPGGTLYNAQLDEMHAYFQKKYGTIVRFPGVLGRPPLVITYDPDDMRRVYRMEGQWPFRRGLDSISYWRRNVRKDLFKNFHGLIDEQGEAWQKYRTMFNPVMMQPKTVSLYVPEIDSVARDFIGVVKKSLDSKNEAPGDFGAYVQRYALEAIGTIALEARLNVLDASEGKKGTELANLVDRMFYLTYQLDFLPSIWHYIKTPTFYQLMKVLDRSTEIIMEYIDQAVARLDSEGSQKPEELQSVLYKLLKIDRECAVVMAMDMLAVGIDTTSSTLKSLLYLLATHPDKQQRLREEILTILPSKSDLLTPQKLKNLPYLRACMKEQHRVIPTVAGNARRLNQDIVLQGYQVPAGVDIVMTHGLISCQEEFFPRSKEFVPERWLKDESEAEAVECPHAKTSHPFAYMPFGFGTRACIGKRFAELETAILVTRMVREFEMTWHYPPPKIETHVIKSITGDLKIRLNSTQF